MLYNKYMRLIRRLFRACSRLDPLKAMTTDYRWMCWAEGAMFSLGESFDAERRQKRLASSGRRKQGAVDGM